MGPSSLPIIPSLSSSSESVDYANVIDSDFKLLVLHEFHSTKKIKPKEKVARWSLLLRDFFRKRQFGWNVFRQFEGIFSFIWPGRFPLLISHMNSFSSHFQEIPSYQSHASLSFKSDSYPHVKHIITMQEESAYVRIVYETARHSKKTKPQSKQSKQPSSNSKHSKRTPNYGAITCRVIKRKI